MLEELFHHITRAAPADVRADAFPIDEHLAVVVDRFEVQQQSTARFALVLKRAAIPQHFVGLQQMTDAGQGSFDGERNQDRL